MGHDLDDEELRATRKLLGLDKKEGIEEDIKILEKFKNNEIQRDKLERDNRCGGWKIGDIYKHLELNIAIENLLQDYERQKQRNEEHRKINGELREKENKTFSLGEIEVNLALYIKENYIPKQNVFKKINYYNDNIKHSQFIKDKEAEDFYYDLKRAFEKLLKESEENNIKKISEELREIILKLEEGR